MRDEERLHLVLRLGLVPFDRREDAPIELDRLEEEVEHRGRDLDSPEAQVVEQVLELVRQAAHDRGAEEPREPLQRVNGAEDVVDEVGVARAALHELVEREEIATQPVDELLRLREELLARLLAERVASAVSLPAIG